MGFLHNYLLLLFILSFSVSQGTLTISTSAAIASHHRCHHDDRSALVQLKKDVLNHSSISINFYENSSTKVEKWDLKTDCCTWDGVTCNPAGQVIDLNLSFSRISGNIDSIFDLRHLQRLDLARNNFRLSPIPNGFEKLVNLTHLNLSFSCFSDQIPEGISKLTKLTSLDLSTIPFCELPPTFDDPGFNRIFGFEELHRLRLERPNLQSFFQNLNALTELYLNNVDLSAQGSNWSEALSRALPNLEVLSLPNCRLSGPIHPSFSSLRSLFYIQLEGNSLSSEVPVLLADLSGLQVLNLASCKLNGNFPEKVFLLPKLKNIDISKNSLLTGKFPEFPLHSSLQFLSLYETNFQGKLPESVSNLRSLETLLLYSCNFSGLIPSSLANLSKIVELDISFNNFNGGLPPFHKSSLPNLEDLRFSYNLVIGPINPSILTLPSQKTLWLDNNHFSGEVEESSDASSSVLENLYLNGNNLSGPIPSSISKLPNIVSLSLANNFFSGGVKMVMFQNLKNLTSLDLSSNRLTIEQDDRSFAFPQLEELKLSRCNLTYFPTFLREQVQLRVLNLSDNKLHGNVPHWLWKSTLNELDLSQNAVDFPEEILPGSSDQNDSATYGDESFAALGKLVMRSCNVRSFPKFLKQNLEGLWFLDLSDNKINGRVPQWMWKSTLQYVNVSHNQLYAMDEFPRNTSLFSLQTLDLRSNILEGSLPKGICDLRNLSIFDASRNHFTGLIPECLGKIGTISVLNLQRNYYQRIPQDFASASSLRSLNINGNLLEGQLPRSLANCTKLEVLDLGNNRLSDTFPDWLNQLPELRVLVLRNNSLYGRIQLPQKEFFLPNLGIVDLSSNHFTGELSEEFLYSLTAMAVTGKNKSVAKTIGKYEYYQDSVTIMSKGLEMLLVRILTIYVSLDLSNNKLHGSIPRDVGDLKSLVVLNLSRNAFDGQIPSSVADLTELESLDLSQNQLSGTIPAQLTGLTFLSALNLSFNQLEGHIPSGYQFNTFSADSYRGNVNLCGLPLSKKCKDADGTRLPSGQGESSERDSTIFDWKFAMAGFSCGIVIGFIVGYTFLSEMVMDYLGRAYPNWGGKKHGRRSKHTRRFKSRG